MTRPAQTGFYAIHSNHLEDLRRAVVHLCKQDPLPPLTDETFLVQSNGIAQWLKMALAEDPSTDGSAGGLGIAASMAFLFPARFIWQAYRAILPAEDVPETSPFDKPRLVWRLYRLLPELVTESEVYAPLARFLEGDEPDRRRFQLAEKIADLFDQYQVFRADWLAAWEAGRDELLTARSRTHALTGDDAWQPALWRRLVADVGVLAHTSRARIHTRFVEEGQRLEKPANPALLPPRIVVFGVSSLPHQALEALAVLSRFSQVVLCVHNPCQYYWADIISDRDLFRAEAKRGRAHPVLSGLTDEDQLHLHANPLLATWGKQGRDYIRLLDEFDQPADYAEALSTPDQTIDIYSEHGDPARPTLLHQLQNDILHLTPLPELKAEQRTLDPTRDGSIRFHSAHSPQREVEILHDQLLAAFNQDESLRPRDVMVMVPDINVYAPHIQAVFGHHGPDDQRHIPFTISDQGQRHHEPVLIALETLLSLPHHRFGMSEILSLLEVPSLRARFGLAESDLPQLHEWVDGAQIRWGLNAHQRAALDLPEALERNTWQAGLRAMLLGYSLSPGSTWAGVEPYTEVGGLQAGLAGKLADFVEQLAGLWEALQTDRTPAEWDSLLSGLLADFFAAAEDNDLLLLNRFRRQLDQWLDNTLAAGLENQPLPLTLLQDVLLSGLDEGGLNQRFLAGKVNFATLMPMRAIPFRRVCLLGMNDGDYPRSRPPADFDLMGQDYRPGDRSRREDDRYLFLEALLSAREHLTVSWVGRSIKDDSDRPPSVLVGQLRDHLDALWTVPANGETDRDKTPTTSQALTTEHPLQPFSPRYFPAEPESALFTYEAEWRQAHHAPAPDEQSTVLPYQAPEEPLTLNDLTRFLKDPIEAFYQRRLQVRFEAVEDEDTDNERFDLNGLERWELDRRLIHEAVLKAETDEDLADRLSDQLDRLARAGELGLGTTEFRLREELADRMPDLFQRWQKERAAWPEAETEPLPVRYQAHSELGTIKLDDALDGLRTDAKGARCRVVIAESNLLRSQGSGKQHHYRNLLPYWVAHLAAQVVASPVTTRILGKEENKVVELAPLPANEAGERLDTILSAWMEGMTRPLPLHSGAGFAWINTLAKSPDEPAKARSAAETVWQADLERDAGYLRGAFPQPEALLDHPEFVAYAEALYEPLWQAVQGESKAGKSAKGETEGTA